MFSKEESREEDKENLDKEQIDPITEMVEKNKVEQNFMQILFT